MNLGAGRIVYQEYTRIGKAVADGSFHHNEAVVKACDAAKEQGGAVHIMGLLSPGGVHSHQDHLLAAVEAAKQRGHDAIFVHAILDGRDTPPRSALGFIDDFEAGLKRIGVGRIASVTGRYFTMDRDNRWDRVARGYRVMTDGDGHVALSARAAVLSAYERDQNDEFVEPTVITELGAPLSMIQDGDAVLCMNFRADRVREISAAFTKDDFDGFERGARLQLAAYVCLTQYSEDLTNVLVAFPPQKLTHILGEEISRLGLKQLRAAETEKYAHVTYFFNGGEESPFENEDRLLIPSPDVATYDLKPEMSAVELTDQVIERVQSGAYDLIVVNYANPDMVGHTGVYEAAVTAIETVDACLGRLWEAVRQAGGEMLITADHGNADQMVDGDAPHTAHTNNAAPLIYLGEREAALEHGALCDIAPTLLALMDLPQPAEMDGRALVTLRAHAA
ncbi:putative phosphoglyceromutase [Magnetofaba australis IT-1]|uniref:2,3-bisphosphoglycerate-independent phosphoglycerate mutase n=2 Tax=Magnetofaba TaxID=1472292 RepID=A0A1Y2K8D3_9PROT|nr:putative phosphoglyceromutase [Magnetofaba australis IT-1]